MLTLFLIGLAIAVGYFAITWAISVKMKNYGLVDAAWSYGVAILAPIYALHSPGDATRKWLVTVIGVLWSLRLGTYILVRVIKHHPVEDVRYESLRERWPGPAMFLAFFELQALIVVVFSLPFLFVAFNARTGLSPVEIAGLTLAALALCGEALADRQMRAFKADPANKGKVCQAGSVALLAASELFLRVTHLVGFFPRRARLPLGLDDHRLPAAHATIPAQGHRHPADRGIRREEQGRRLPRIPAHDFGLRALVSERLARAIARAFLSNRELSFRIGGAVAYPCCQSAIYPHATSGRRHHISLHRHRAQFPALGDASAGDGAGAGAA